MKLVDVILIILILGSAGVFFTQKNHSGNCRNGQVQLTHEVKAMIDKEFANPVASGGEPSGLAGVLAQASLIEKDLEDVQALARQNLQIFKDQIAGLRTLQTRKQGGETDRIRFTEILTKQVISACSKRKPGKF